MPPWWNGIHSWLKPLGSKQHVGSNPTGGTNKTRVEKWHSTRNRDEVHIFAQEEDGKEVYIIGYNPQIINPDIIKEWLEFHNYEFPEDD